MMKASALLIRIVLLSFVSAFVLPTSADELGELKESFAQRYPQLQAYKQAGKIGETSTGMTEAVTAGDAGVSRVVSGENADRTRLYALLAARQGVPAAVVAQRNAARNFGKARPGEWLKDQNGWKQKK